MQSIVTVGTGVCTVLFFVLVLLLLFKGRKGTVGLIEAGLLDASKIEDAVAPLVETLPGAGPYFHLLHEITIAARTGVQTAEQLHSNDPTIDRKQIATNFVHDTLAELGITLTDRVKRLVDAAIEGAVYGMPTKTGQAPTAPQTDDQTPLSATSDPAPSPEAILSRAAQEATVAVAHQVAAQVLLAASLPKGNT